LGVPSAAQRRPALGRMPHRAVALGVVQHRRRCMTLPPPKGRPYAREMPPCLRAIRATPIPRRTRTPRSRVLQASKVIPLPRMSRPRKPRAYASAMARSMMSIRSGIRRGCKCTARRTHHPRRDQHALDRTWCDRTRSAAVLHVPGSLSSALTTMYLGRAGSRGTKLHFIPVESPLRPCRAGWTSSFVQDLFRRHGQRLPQRRIAIRARYVSMAAEAGRPKRLSDLDFERARFV